MRNLPDNYNRCHGTQCLIKDSCARYTSLPPEGNAKCRTVYTDFSLMVKSVAKCNMLEDNKGMSGG